MTGQEIVALGLVSVAAGYLVRKLTGWPRGRRPQGPQVSTRLGRGLRKAEQQRRRGH